MAIGNFFRQQKHKQFEYQPVFYDADKENLDKRIKKHQVKKEESTTYVPDVKGKMKEYLITDNKSKSKLSSIRLIIVAVTIGLIALIFYYLIEIISFLMSNV